MVMMYVYKVQNLENGKVYVGQTKNPSVRKAGHFYCARRGDRRPLYAAIRKHGAENFLFEVIEECDETSICEREKHWISQLNSFDSEKGYNITPGGEFGNRGYKHTEETKKKISEALQGKVVSDETRAKMSNSSKGHITSEETKAKIGQAVSGDQNGNFGKKLSDDTREKIGQKLKGRKLSDAHRANISTAQRGQKRPRKRD